MQLEEGRRHQAHKEDQPDRSLARPRGDEQTMHRGCHHRSSLQFLTRQEGIDTRKNDEVPIISSFRKWARQKVKKKFFLYAILCI